LAGTALSGWRHQASSVTLATSTQASGQQPAVVGWHSAGRTQALTFRPGYGHLIPGQGLAPLPITGTVTLTAGPASRAIPAIATTAFLAATGNRVGGRAIVAAGAYHLPVRIVAAIRSFPTAGSGGALIVDQGAAQALLAAQSGPPLPVTSWWLATVAGQVPRGLPPAQVTSFRQLLARMLANPLAAAPQRAALALIVAAALLAMLGFSVSVAASVSERRARAALLSALGVTRLAQARQLCLEQALLAVPSALAGLVVGTLLAHLLVPAVTLTDQAALPEPPALVYVPAGWAITLAAVVAAIPVLAAALTVVRKPDPAAELRAAVAT
jgi:hypothetical protein